MTSREGVVAADFDLELAWATWLQTRWPGCSTGDRQEGIGTMWQITAKHGRHRGASWAISEKPLLLGRSRNCDVVIQDPEVSREHCVVGIEGETLFLEDLRSNNASLVNGQPVSRCLLHVGDEVSVGNATFVVTRGGDYGSFDPRSVTQRTTIHPALFAELSNAPESQAIQARPRNIRDLGALHRLVMGLANCETEPEVMRAMIDCVVEHLSATNCLAVRYRSRWNMFSVYPPDYPLDDESTAAMQECVRTNAPVERARDAAAAKGAARGCFVPLSLGAEPVGMLGMELGEGPEDLAGDIGFAWAIARTTAPYLVAVDRSQTLAGARAGGESRGTPGAVLVGESSAAQQMRKLAEMAAGVDLPVLIHGETGTGKELVAGLIHKLSPRAGKPFIAVNCAAIPDNLFESEFFGHAKGAFTGAQEKRQGLLSEAHEGMIFLDEIGDLSRSNQARLLRAIETGTFRPIGSRTEVAVDIRVIAASNRDLLRLVQQEEFRADLYFRLSGFEISLAPLRTRQEDIPLLVEHFIREYVAEREMPAPVIGPEEMLYLKEQQWPGNIRELRHFVRRVMAFPAEKLTRDYFMTLLHRPVETESPAETTLEALERAHVLKVLREHGGQVAKAAEALGMHRNTLRRKIKEYGL
ncbi:MAG: sigma 54-dependent Fis family transcriptional regulator [Candidatus Hydrogenedentes bacterium]|nr:sigma 54-dependent Fis family transcriptional regulator [Candidatus Hydrogenedentota bacterium]